MHSSGIESIALPRKHAKTHLSSLYLRYLCLKTPIYSLYLHILHLFSHYFTVLIIFLSTFILFYLDLSGILSCSVLYRDASSWITWLRLVSRCLVQKSIAGLLTRRGPSSRRPPRFNPGRHEGSLSLCFALSIFYMDGMLWVGLGAVGGLGCFGMKMCGASGGGFDFCAKLSHNFLLICVFVPFFDQFCPLFVLYMRFLSSF